VAGGRAKRPELATVERHDEIRPEPIREHRHGGVRAAEREISVIARASRELCPVIRRGSFRAWLQFEVDPSTAGGVLTQTAFFEPKGLPGLAYWYLLYPIHALIFRGMSRAIAKRAGVP